MYDDYGNYIGEDFASGTGVSDPGWTDNGDGSVTDPSGNIYDWNGNYLGTDNGDGSWTSGDGQIYDNQNNFIGLDNGDGTWTDVYGTTYGADGQPITSSGSTDTSAAGSDNVTVPSNWIDNQDGTVTDPTTGDVWGIDGSYLGNTADAGVGGGNVALDPDEFGDVYTVNGKWVGNLFGLPAPGSPNATSARGAGQGTPGGAYSAGGSLGGGQSGQQSAQQLAQQLKQMLDAAKSSGASFNQQAAIASALKNAQAKTSSPSSALLIAAVAALGAVVLFRRE